MLGTNQTDYGQAPVSRHSTCVAVPRFKCMGRHADSQRDARRLRTCSAEPLKPAYELYGELLLELNRPADAIEKFQASLLRLPSRPRSLLGLARALEQIGDQAGAEEQYRKLSDVWGDRESFSRL